MGLRSFINHFIIRFTYYYYSYITLYSHLNDILHVWWQCNVTLNIDLFNDHSGAVADAGPAADDAVGAAARVQHARVAHGALRRLQPGTHNHDSLTLGKKDIDAAISSVCKGKMHSRMMFAVCGSISQLK